MRTVSRLSRWLCALVLLPLWPMASQKPGELYVSPLKNFSVAVPKFGFGTRVQKSNNRDRGLVVFIGGAVVDGGEVLLPGLEEATHAIPEPYNFLYRVVHHLNK